MFRLHRVLLLLAILLLLPLFSRAQEPIASPSISTETAREYQNSATGIRQQLEDALAAAREHNRPKLELAVKQMEIPNYKAWFTNSFGQEEGESWAFLYGRNLVSNNSELISDFIQFGEEQGELEIRKVNDAPKSDLEAALMDALQRPAEIFYAGWKKRPSGRAEPFSEGSIGYFVFLDGRFRWNGTIRTLSSKTIGESGNVPSEATSGAETAYVPGGPSATTKKSGPFKPGVGGVTYPSCTFCPDPGYPKEARAKHIEGTVVLQAIIQPDGRATDILVLRTPDAGMAQAALESVSKWRFKPARGEDKEPVAVIVPIEVTFRLVN